MAERTPQERETLIFKTPEAAGEFRERVEEQLDQQPAPDVARPREVIAEEVAAEFAKHGEGANSLHVPWEHTPEEHEEAQQLVDTAFAEDLEVALKKAQRSHNYPRNIDLLHDVLTGELYDLLQQARLDTVPIKVRLLVMAIVVVVALFAVFLALFFTF